MKLFNLFKKKEENDEPINNSPELLSVKLFFIDKPIIEEEEIKRSLVKRFENVNFPKLEDSPPNSRQYFFEDYEVQLSDGKIPAQGTIFMPDTKGVDLNKLETSFLQSWNWRAAKSVVSQCNHEVLLTDLMSRGLDYKLRLECFQKFTTSIVEAMKPIAIWISNSEKIMNKEEYLEIFSENEYQNLNGFLNVRMFNIQNSKNQTIMDTLGLNALGLPDFEIKYKEYDPSIIAGLLFNYGHYIFENGVVIENGNTIQGVEENQTWKCFFKTSSVGPERVVIEIETGE